MKRRQTEPRGKVNSVALGILPRILTVWPITGLMNLAQQQIRSTLNNITTSRWLEFAGFIPFGDNPIRPFLGDTGVFSNHLIIILI